MPKFLQHTKKAKHNCKLLEEMEKNNLHEQFSDWYVTISYYCSIHFFEAIIFKAQNLKIKKKGIDPLSIDTCNHSYDAKLSYETDSDHLARQLLIRDNPKIFPDSVYSIYCDLYEMSRTAKYEIWPAGNNDWSFCKEKLKEIISFFPRFLN